MSSASACVEYDVPVPVPVPVVGAGGATDSAGVVLSPVVPSLPSTLRPPRPSFPVT